MANKNKTARPAARKQSHTKTKKTVATRSAAASKREPITQVVERSQPRMAIEPPKMKGELPVPTATFYF